jgi:hypothetical protein
MSDQGQGRKRSSVLSAPKQGGTGGVRLVCPPGRGGWA